MNSTEHETWPELAISARIGGHMREEDVSAALDMLTSRATGGYRTRTRTRCSTIRAMRHMTQYERQRGRRTPPGISGLNRSAFEQTYPLDCHSAATQHLAIRHLRCWGVRRALRATRRVLAN